MRCLVDFFDFISNVFHYIDSEIINIEYKLLARCKTTVLIDFEKS